MKVSVKWFLTGKISTFEESDEILNPNSTIAEVKGLIQIRFGFNASEIVIIKDNLIENEETLGSQGIVGGASDPVLTAHVIRESELEPSNVESSIDEFSHADFALAMKMLGKPVSVSSERLAVMRANAPRQRPAFLDQPSVVSPPQAVSAPAPAKPTPPVNKSEAFRIFADVLYGLRKEGVDEQLRLCYPGVDPLPFWDLRVPETFRGLDRESAPGEICLEVFFFGEFGIIKDHQKLIALVHQTIESQVGVRFRTPFPIREAGCMYPLITVPIAINEVDAMVLGDFVFEDFGTSRENRATAKGSKNAASEGAVAGPGCATQ